MSHPEVPLISFTGSQPTAERITQLSAPHCKKLSLELGGKNPAIVFEDANLEECVPTTVRSSFANQVCPLGFRLFLTLWPCHTGSVSSQCKTRGAFLWKENGHMCYSTDRLFSVDVHMQPRRVTASVQASSSSSGTSLGHSDWLLLLHAAPSSYSQSCPQSRYPVSNDPNSPSPNIPNAFSLLEINTGTGPALASYLRVRAELQGNFASPEMVAQISSWGPYFSSESSRPWCPKG